MKVQTGPNRRGIGIINAGNKTQPSNTSYNREAIPEQTDSEQCTSSRLLLYHHNSIGKINGLALPNTQQYFSKGSASFRQQNINTSNITTSNHNTSNHNTSNHNASNQHRMQNVSAGERLQSIRLSNLSKISRLDSELDDIEKMKRIFQSKKSKGDLHNQSAATINQSFDINQMSNQMFDHNSNQMSNKRNNTIGCHQNNSSHLNTNSKHNKSSEKHRVKPSNTPSFSKLAVPVRQFEESEESKSISIRETPRPAINPNNSSSIPINTYTHSYSCHSSTNSHSNSYQNYQHTNSYQHQARTHNTSPISQKDSFKFQKPEMISCNTEQYDHEYIHEYNHQGNHQNIHQYIHQGNHQDDYFDHCQAIDNSEAIAHENNQDNRDEQQDHQDEERQDEYSYVEQPKPNCCQRAMSQFMSEVSAQMQSLHERILKLEETNAGLMRKNHESVQANQECKARIHALEGEKQQIAGKCQRYKEEKEELESLFKDVLFKREKEKLKEKDKDKLKENINHGQQLQLHRLHTANTAKPSRDSDKPSQSKLKVQNLLQKLHIKVEK